MFTFTFNVFLLQREIEREREREREKWWSLSRWEIFSQIRKKGKVASCQFTSPCTFIRGNILHIWCVVVTNLSVCLFVCQQVACDVVTVFSIGVAVPCQSQSVESVNRLVDQSISHDSLVSLLISHSVSVSVPVHTPARPFAPLARSGFPPLLPWTYYVYYAYVYYHTHTHTHTMLPITFLLPFLPPLHDRARREEQRTTTTYPRTNPSTLRVHRFHLRGSPCLVRNPTFNPCTGDTSDNSTLIVNCGASHVARDMIYVEKPINKKTKREREREREREESSPWWRSHPGQPFKNTLWSNSRCKISRDAGTEMETETETETRNRRGKNKTLVDLAFRKISRERPGKRRYICVYIYIYICIYMCIYIYIYIIVQSSDWTYRVCSKE